MLCSLLNLTWLRAFMSFNLALIDSWAEMLL